MAQPLRDPVIDEIREVRHRISERFNHDPEKLLEYYMRLQEEYKDRLLSSPRVPEPLPKA
jgi:hypothetical protein